MSLKFKEYITEAIGIEIVKKALVGKPIWDYKTQLTEEFDGKYRKIIGRIEPDISMLDNHPIYNRMVDIFGFRKYTITKDGYVGGYVTKDKQQYKIGKLLNKWNQDKSDDEYGKLNKLIDSFRDDPLRQQNRKPYLVVVSKHPYDVMGASTDRNWTSCVNLGGGIIYNKAKTKVEKEKGLNADRLLDSLHTPFMVAYLVDPDDVNTQGKIMIQRPLSRILIYPFKAKSDESHDDEEFDYNWSIGDVYGIKSEKFRSIVYNWVEELNQTYSESERFEKMSDVYYDSFDESLVRTYLDLEEIEDLFNEEANRQNLNFGSIEEIWEGSASSFYIYDLKLETFIEKVYLNNEFTSDKEYSENFFIEMIKNLLRMSMFSRFYGDIDDLDIFRIYDDTGTVHMDRIPIRGIPESIRQFYDYQEEELQEEYGPNFEFFVLLDYLSKYSHIDVGVDSSDLNTNLEMYFEQIRPIVSDKLLEQGIDPDPKNWKQLNEDVFREVHESITDQFRM